MKKKLIIIVSIVLAVLLTALILILTLVGTLVNNNFSDTDTNSSGVVSSNDESSSQTSTPTTSSNITESKNETTSTPTTSSNITESKNETTSTPTTSAPIRVMSYNILHPDWSTAANSAVEKRIKIVRDIILDYAPDVIGLQEAGAGWHTALESYLGGSNGYKIACKLTNAGKQNMTTFLYNTKTLKLVDEYVIDVDANSDIRVVSVAVFEKLSDGEKFVVTNTHPAPASSQEVHYIRHMKYITSILNSELQKYKDLPFIMAGDFNTTEQSEYYENFMTDTGVKDAKYEANAILHNYCTFSGLNEPPKEGNSRCIDHIFVNEKVSVRLFDVIIDHEVEKASDHIPIYADIIFNTSEQ